jgi:hypothetical protein
MKTQKTKTIKIGPFSRTKTVEYDSDNYDQKGIMAGTIYKGKNIPIKKKKTVVTSTPRKTVTKTTDYSPISYYGKQTKTKTKVVKRK